jgi:hypothetical protein
VKGKYYSQLIKEKINIGFQSSRFPSEGEEPPF